MKQSLFLLICLAGWLNPVSAQIPAREQLVGTWIGVHSEWDMDFTCPLPTYIQLDADSTYHLGMVDGSAKERTSTWAIHDESVRLDTIRFAPRLITIQNNLLRIGTNYPMIFRRFTNVMIDSARVYQQLSGRVWQSDSLTISLYTNGKVALEKPVTRQRTIHFWRLARFDKSIFLIIEGNQYTRNRGYKPLLQVVGLSLKQLQAIGWNGRTVTTEGFRFIRNLAPSDTCRSSDFQTCSNCFARRWRENGIVRSDKRYELTQLFSSKYQPISQVGESGLIRVQFVINCEGEQGLFELRGFDETYCPKTFDSRITGQLLAICRDQAIAALSLRKPDNADDWVQDSAVSLTFRLKDGRLTDILP